MMSRRDALRSYRRAYRRAYCHVYFALPPDRPEMREMGKRGDRLQLVFARCGVSADDAPNEVVDAMTSADVRYLIEHDGAEEELPW